jgi:hypothetical protein
MSAPQIKFFLFSNRSPSCRFLKNTLEASTARDAPLGYLMYSHAELVAEALLTLKRTMNPVEVPWDHRYAFYLHSRTGVIIFKDSLPCFKTR